MLEAKNNIKILRVENGLTQGGLAEKVRVTQTAVSQWELGNSYPDMKIAIELAKYFGVSLDFLIGLTDERRTQYLANNIHDSNFVQGNGSVAVGSDALLSKEDSISEIIRIYKESNFRGKAKLINTALELDDENKRNNGEGLE